jgi:hypothetical protein
VNPATDALLILALVFAAWLACVRFFPLKTCPRCGGGRRIPGGGGHRDCGRCGSTGRVRRFGAGREKS